MSRFAWIFLIVGAAAAVALGAWTEMGTKHKEAAGVLGILVAIAGAAIIFIWIARLIFGASDVLASWHLPDERRRK